MFVHVCHGLEQLVHEHFDRGRFDVRFSTSDHFVDVQVHQFEHEGEASCGRVIKNFLEIDDVRVRIQSAQCLDLSKGVDLIQALERTFHAFDRIAFPGEEGLGFQHLGESSFAFLGHQAILCDGKGCNEQSVDEKGNKVRRERVSEIGKLTLVDAPRKRRNKTCRSLVAG
jgi:hypothetical protein